MSTLYDVEPILYESTDRIQLSREAEVQLHTTFHTQEQTE